MSANFIVCVISGTLSLEWLFFSSSSGAVFSCLLAYLIRFLLDARYGKFFLLLIGYCSTTLNILKLSPLQLGCLKIVWSFWGHFWALLRIRAPCRLITRCCSSAVFSVWCLAYYGIFPLWLVGTQSPSSPVWAPGMVLPVSWGGPFLFFKFYWFIYGPGDLRCCTGFSLVVVWWLLLQWILLLWYTGSKAHRLQ